MPALCLCASCDLVCVCLPFLVSVSNVVGKVVQYRGMIPGFGARRLTVATSIPDPNDPFSFTTSVFVGAIWVLVSASVCL